MDEEESDLGEIVRQALRVAKRGRWWILSMGLAAVLLAAGALSFVPDVYRSESTILVVEQQIPQNLVAPLSNSTGTQKLQAMTQEVLSRSSLLKIINETHLYGETKLPPDAVVERFRKSIEITPTDVARDGTFNGFTIAYSASTPVRAQEVTRMLSSLFIERHAETRSNRTKTTVTFLKERLSEKRKQAAELQEQIRDFKARHAGRLPDSRLANTTRTAELQAQLQATRFSLGRANQQRAIWAAKLQGSFKDRLTRLQTERTALLARLTPKHPEVIRRAGEIEQIERILGSLHTGAAVAEELRGSLEAGDAVIGQLQGQLEVNRLEIENLLQDEKRVQTLLSEAQRTLQAGPALEQQLAAMMRESESLNEELAKIEDMDQKSSLSLDMERQQQGEQFRQLDFPVLPLKPISPARFRITAIAGAAGLLLGFAVAFLLDVRKACFYTEQQVRRKFPAPMVLSIPDLPTPAELTLRKRKARLEWVAGSLVAAAIAAVEIYLYTSS